METEVISSFFSHSLPHQEDTITVGDEFLHLMDELNNSLEQFELPATIHCVYNPTIYARVTFEMYVKKYCNSKKRIMYFGMNPGPWGMSQTGVPFGEVDFVKNWLQIHGPVEKPLQEIAARPVNGFNCTRTEISGKRFWGFFRDLCGTPDKFFESSFVYNYLPQQWMRNNGCNLTPGDFKSNEMEQLYAICDPTFRKIIELYKVETIVAIGKFCETRAKKVIQKYFSSDTIKVFYLPHPSPRAVNNNDWHEKALRFLEQHNLVQYYK